MSGMGKKLIRVSVQGYNTKHDIDKLIKALSVLFFLIFFCDLGIGLFEFVEQLAEFG